MQSKNIIVTLCLFRNFVHITKINKLRRVGFTDEGSGKLWAQKDNCTCIKAGWEWGREWGKKKRNELRNKHLRLLKYCSFSSPRWSLILAKAMWFLCQMAQRNRIFRFFGIYTLMHFLFFFLYQPLVKHYSFFCSCLI